MKRFAKCVTLVLGAAVGMPLAACGIDVHAPSGLPVHGRKAGEERPGPLPGAMLVGHISGSIPQVALLSWQSGGVTLNDKPGGTYDFCAAYPVGTTGCELCGHEDFSLDAGQEHGRVVDLSRCPGDVSFGHFAVVEYIRGGSLVQSLSLRPGGDEYELNVRNATTGEAAPAAVVVDRTYTYLGNVPDPVVLQLTVRRDGTSKGGRKNLAVVFSSWLPH